MKATRIFTLITLALFTALRAVAVPVDSLPAGTKISLSILIPGDATPNKINYTIPAPVITVPPVVIQDPKLLRDGQVVGTRQGHTLTVRSVNGKLYLTEDVGNGNFLFRGANLLKRSDTQTSFAGLIDQLSGGSTTFDGLTEPVGVSAPTGYSRKQFSDGAVYYGPSDSSPPITTPIIDLPKSNNSTGQYIDGGAGLFSPVVQWSEGKARIVNGITPSIGKDEALYYFISGQPAVSALPTQYTLNPGDEVGLMVAVVSGGTPPSDGRNWTRKGWSTIIIGQSPTGVTSLEKVEGQAGRPGWLRQNDLWVPMAQKYAPDFTLPDNKKHYAVRKRTDITSSSIVGKAGVNAVMDTGLEGPLQINWIHSSIWNNSGKSPATTGHPVSSLNQQDCENVAMTLPLCYAEANELYEGSPWGSYDPSLIQFHWFYMKRKAMYEAAGLPYRQYCTYGGWDNYNGDPWQFQTGDGSNKAPNDPFFKAKIASVAAARASCSYFNTREAEGGGAIIKHYADQSNYASRYYNKAFAAEVMAKGMGVAPGMNPEKLMFVMWPHVEGLGGAEGFQHNGFSVDRKVGNLGIVRQRNEHPQIDYDYLLGNIFCIGFCRTGGYLPFDQRTRYGTDSLSVVPGADMTWLPTMANPPPYVADGYPIEPLRWHDAGPEAAYYYSLCSRTAGTPWLYCAYTEEGSPRVDVQPDGTTILEHASANDGAYSETGRRGRPDAMYRIKGNALDIWVFDPSRPKTSRKTITLNPFGNKTITVTDLPGSTLRLYNQTL